jgi:hypothetical protein
VLGAGLLPVLVPERAPAVWPFAARVKNAANETVANILLICILILS